MTEEERNQFNELAARVHVQQLVLVELCRRHFDGNDITAFFAPLDAVVARGNPELAGHLDKALAAFRFEIMKPVMGD